MANRYSSVKCLPDTTNSMVDLDGFSKLSLLLSRLSAIALSNAISVNILSLSPMCLQIIPNEEECESCFLG